MSVEDRAITAHELLANALERETTLRKRLAIAEASASAAQAKLVMFEEAAKIIVESLKMVSGSGPAHDFFMSGVDKLREALEKKP